MESLLKTSEVLHQACLDVVLFDGRPWKVGGTTWARHQAGKPSSVRGRQVEPLSDVGKVICVKGSSVAAARGNLRERDVRGDRRLPPGGIVRAIIQQQVPKIGWPIGADSCKRAQAHERGAVAIESKDPQVGPRQRQAQSQR